MKHILIISFLLVSLLSYSQDKKPNYNKYKNGNFYTTHINEKGKKDTLIIRREGTVQTESTFIDGEEDIVLKLKVIWIND